MSRCGDCGLDVDHCHGTLVIHHDRTWECTDPDCTFAELMTHAFVIDCRTVAGGCCTVDEQADFAVAS